MKRVAILMATYNGEKFVGEQIQSIINQSYNNWNLFIRDDCSTDSTPSIIAKYASSDSRIRIVNDDLGNIGPLMNFSTLMKQCDGWGYVVFADQDDIWFKKKVYSTIRAFSGSELELVYTNYTVAEKYTQSVNDAIYRKNPPYEATSKILLLQNWIMGCTMALTGQLCKIVSSIPKVADNHDNWIANVAAVIGKISYYSEPTMFHRIHNNNVTQSLQTKKILKVIVRTFNRFKQRKVSMNKKTVFLDELLKVTKPFPDTINRGYVVYFKKLLIKKCFVRIRLLYHGYCGVNFKQTVVLILTL